MFRSRRGALLAGVGVIDAVATWRPTEVSRSVPLLAVAITRELRKKSITSDFPKTCIYIFDFRCLEKLR